MTYGAPTTYTKIVPERGCGFILKRIYDLTENPNMPRGSYCKNPTKQDVYCGTSWANRPSFASLLWSSLIKDGLIESNGGTQEYKYYKFYKRSSVGTRATGRYEASNGYTVRYHLTPKGRGILFDMMARIPDNLMRLNTVGSVAEYDAKKDWAPKVEDWRDDDFLEPGETKEKWMARNGVTPPPTPDERDILEKEALDCAKLAADYAGENQKLRAEKDDLNARLKKLADRFVNLETEIATTRNELDSLINWDK
jgi:hypothetical protein